MWLPMAAVALCAGIGAPAWAVSPQVGGTSQSAPFIWRAQDVVNAIGVATHIDYLNSGSAYANTASVLSALQWLGVHEIRDDLPVFPPGDQRLVPYTTMFNAGFKMSLVIPGPVTFAPYATLMDAAHDNLDRLATRYPGKIFAVEGQNEPYLPLNTPGTYTYKGLSGPPAVARNQIDLYAMVNGDALLSGIPVWEFSLASPPYKNLQYREVYAADSTVVTSFDVASVGLYGGVWSPLFQMKQQIVYPYDAVLSGASVISGPYSGAMAGRPEGVKETGLTASNPPILSLGISDYTTQAKMLPSTLMDGLKLGAIHENIYELADVYADPASNHTGYHFGLFDHSMNPKPGAYAVKNLLAHLVDNSSNATTFTTTMLNIGVSGFPITDPIPHVVASGSAMGVETADGTYKIMVWWEPLLWNATTGTPEPAAPVEHVTVGLGKVCASTSIYDPTDNTTIAGPSNTQVIPIALPDHLVMITCEGAS